MPSDHATGDQDRPASQRSLATPDLLVGTTLQDRPSSQMSAISSHGPVVHPLFERSHAQNHLNLPPLKQSFSYSPRSSQHFGQVPRHESISAPAPAFPTTWDKKRKSSFMEEPSILPPLSSLSSERNPPTPISAGSFGFSGVKFPQFSPRSPGISGHGLPPLQHSQTLPNLNVQSLPRPDESASSPSIRPTQAAEQALQSRAQEAFPGRVGYSSGSPPGAASGGPGFINDRLQPRISTGSPQDNASYSPGDSRLTTSQSPELRRVLSPTSMDSAGPDDRSSSFSQLKDRDMITFKSDDGDISIPLDNRSGTKVADEKRRRNAGASARFRERRKQREQEASATIRKLEQKVKDLSTDVDFYRGERDYFRHAVMQMQGSDGHFPRPYRSPRLDRPAVSLGERSSDVSFRTATFTQENVDADRSSGERIVKQRTDRAEAATMGGQPLAYGRTVQSDPAQYQTQNYPRDAIREARQTSSKSGPDQYPITASFHGVTNTSALRPPLPPLRTPSFDPMTRAQQAESASAASQTSHHWAYPPPPPALSGEQALPSHLRRP